LWHVKHHTMSARKLSLPPVALSRLGVELLERAVEGTRVNVSDGRDAVAGAADLRPRLERGQGMYCALSAHPVGICRIDSEERRRGWRDFPAVAFGHGQVP